MSRHGACERARVCETGEVASKSRAVRANGLQATEMCKLASALGRPPLRCRMMAGPAGKITGRELTVSQEYTSRAANIGRARRQTSEGRPLWSRRVTGRGGGVETREPGLTLIRRQTEFPERRLQCQLPLSCPQFPQTPSGRSWSQGDTGNSFFTSSVYSSSSQLSRNSLV